MSIEALAKPRPLQPGETDHTHSKEYVLARGVNVEVDRMNERKKFNDRTTNSDYANSLIEHPTTRMKELGRDDIARDQHELYLHHPEKLSRRQRAMFRIGDKLEQNGVLDLVGDLLEPRPTHDDKRSYWGTGPYKYMSSEERRAYRHSRGYDRR